MLLVFLITAILCTPRVWELKDGRIVMPRWRKAEGHQDLVVGPGESGWVPFRKVSLHLIHAILVAEDDRFFQHQGLDFHEIWQSFLTNVRERRFARGASTITQQVVKMAFLSHDKTIVRKLREMLGAVVLECILSKEDILAWYVNMIELGDGVTGIGEGAAHYFQTEPELLTVIQSVHMALILPGPNRWSKGLRRRKLTAFGHHRFEILLNKMLMAGYVTRLQWEQAMAKGDFGSPVMAGTVPSEDSPIRPGRSEYVEPNTTTW